MAPAAGRTGSIKGNNVPCMDDSGSREPYGNRVRESLNADHSRHAAIDFGSASDNQQASRNSLQMSKPATTVSDQGWVFAVQSDSSVSVFCRLSQIFALAKQPL
jgi:hypothetical protein